MLAMQKDIIFFCQKLVQEKFIYCGINNSVSKEKPLRLEVYRDGQYDRDKNLFASLAGHMVLKQEDRYVPVLEIYEGRSCS